MCINNAYVMCTYVVIYLNVWDDVYLGAPELPYSGCSMRSYRQALSIFPTSDAKGYSVSVRHRFDLNVSQEHSTYNNKVHGPSSLLRAIITPCCQV